MTLSMKRLGSTREQPHTLQLDDFLLAGSSLLLHMEKLAGLKVLAKKSYALTDDFEAYFSYKDRLFVMESPFSLIEIVLLGQQPDEALFSEVEEHVRNYGVIDGMLAPFAFFRYLFTRPDLPYEVFQQYGVKVEGAR